MQFIYFFFILYFSLQTTKHKIKIQKLKKMENKNENEKVLTVQEKVDELYNKKMTFVQWLKYFDTLIDRNTFLMKRSKFGESVTDLLSENRSNFCEDKKKTDDDAIEFLLLTRKLRRGVENNYQFYF